MRLSRLGWTQEMIAEEVGLDRSIISRIVQNTKISDMHNFESTPDLKETLELFNCLRTPNLRENYFIASVPLQGEDWTRRVC
jgi:DNA-binding transcriptional regulator LsrR (DeoR family)